MKSIDKLREHTLCYHFNKTTAYKSSDTLANEIEAEIAANYCELPKDADGVPIHVGDELITSSGVKLKIHVIHLVDDAWWCGEVEGIRYLANKCRHVKPRTLEDVLRDVWKEALDYTKSDIWRSPDEVFAERAAEIRELRVVDNANN